MFELSASSQAAAAAEQLLLQQQPIGSPRCQESHKNSSSAAMLQVLPVLHATIAS